MNMRVIVGASLNSGHLETKEHESAIDRVGALAKATKLGRLIYHWMYARQDRFSGPVLSELLVKAAHRFQISEMHPDRKTLVRACSQAMLEYHSPQCHFCAGAGETIDGNLKTICHACSGGGKRRYPDGERAYALGIDRTIYEQGWGDRVHTLLDILASNDSGAAAECRLQLERTTRFDKSEI